MSRAVKAAGPAGLVPRLERDGEKVYLVDADSAKHRVWDVVYGTAAGGPHRRKPFPPPGPAACAYRVFVSADRAERWYQFRADGSRDLEPAALARQLGASGYAGKEKFDSTTWAAR